MNRIVSLGMDVGWRRTVAHETWVVECERILDICTGTGDMAIELHRFWESQAEIVGIDFSSEAVELARRKISDLNLAEWISFVEADATKMPFGDEEFDALTIGFGFRNIQDRAAALKEFLRVTKPGGILICLEVTQPGALFKPFYFFYMLKLVPIIAGIMKSDKEAYRYLGRSIRAFPGPAEFARFISEAGWTDVRYWKLGLGTVAIHTAIKGGDG